MSRLPSWQCPLEVAAAAAAEAANVAAAEAAARAAEAEAAAVAEAEGAAEHAIDEAAQMAADELIPVMAYVLARAQMPGRLLGELRFLEAFMQEDDSVMLGRLGYALATFQAAVQLLLTLPLAGAEVSGSSGGPAAAAAAAATGAGAGAAVAAEASPPAQRPRSSSWSGRRAARQCSPSPIPVPSGSPESSRQESSRQCGLALSPGHPAEGKEKPSPVRPTKALAAALSEEVQSWLAPYLCATNNKAARARAASVGTPPQHPPELAEWEAQPAVVPGSLVWPGRPATDDGDANDLREPPSVLGVEPPSVLGVENGETLALF